MRVAVVTPILPVPWDKTRGRPVFETIRAMARKVQVVVHFITAEYPKSALLRPRGYLYQQLPGDYSLDGLDLRPSTYPAIAALSRPFNGHVCGRHVRRLLLRDRFDAVLAYWLFPEGFGAQLAARSLGIPCVLGARGSDIRVLDPITRWLTSRCLKSADRLVVVSNELKEQAVHALGARPDRTHVIVNGCDATTFHPRDREALRREHAIPADAEVVLYVGRFVAAKGLNELLDAAAALRKSRPRLRLVLVGDGVFRDTIAEKVRQPELGDLVSVVDALPPSGVARWMALADVLCLPSYSEGYPNVLVEALACGTPVVATDVGGSREIVDDSVGILVPPRDSGALARALDRALASRWDRALISRRFSRSWDQVADDTLAVLEAALRDRASR